ncbi:carboxypeptidase-like regulatory domain-containing protein [Niabella defluvii]|nr:carboxypeptidase-like regulatory domain-containing protein [Niabella sp. I65]
MKESNQPGWRSFIGRKRCGKGTNNGVSTAEDGSYRITVKDEDAVLTFSIVGYNALDVSVKDNNYSQVTLYAAENKMDEVVVIGYGTTKKRSYRCCIKCKSR